MLWACMNYWKSLRTLICGLFLTDPEYAAPTTNTVAFSPVMTESIPNSITSERASTLIKSLMQRTNSNLPILGLNHHLGEQNIPFKRKRLYLLMHD